MYDPPNMLDNQSAFKLAVSANLADSVSVVPFK